MTQSDHSVPGGPVPGGPQPVTADDVDLAIRLSVATLREVSPAAWDGKGGARVLARLFPDAPAAPDPWSALLWATGRAELPGHPLLTSWRWYGKLTSWRWYGKPRS